MQEASYQTKFKMKLYFIAFLFLVLSCKNEESKTGETLTIEDVPIELKTEVVKDSILEVSDEIDDLDSFCTEGRIPALKDFLNEYLVEKNCI